MNGLLFTNQALLGGLSLLAVPILIHLLLRIKKKRLRFSTLQFFLRHDEQATRRRKLRNWLLLAVRVLILLLIVTAFARPYLRPGNAGRNAAPQKELALVLDRSASMMAVDPEGQRWDRAKAAIRKLLSQLGAGDRVALIGCATRAEVLVEPATAAEVLKALDTLNATHGTADLARGLQQAANLFSKTSSRLTNVICVISDLQRASCRNLGSYPIPPEARLEVMNIGDPFPSNVAITDMALRPLDGSRPHVTVVNFSEEDIPLFNLHLLLDGREVSSARLELAGGASTNAVVALPRMEPGWHSAEARIQVKDAQSLDDVRYETFYVSPPVRLLVVEPRQVSKAFQEESFFLVSALDPTFGFSTQAIGSDSGASRTQFLLEKIPPTDLISRLQRHNSPSPYDVIILPGLKPVATDLSSALAQFVKAGGGLLLFLNDSISVNRYNTELPDILPVSLERFETATDLDWRLWEHDEQSPVFAPFAAPNSGNLELSRFTRRASLKPAASASVVARFQDGVPLLIQRTMGKGRVLLANTSADTAWSDWPKHRTFVPWVHSLARFLANREAEDAQPVPAVTAGSETELDLGSEFSNQRLTVVGPDHQETLRTADGQGAVRDLDLVTSGIYHVRTVQGQEMRRLAVNVPAAESDLGAMSPSEFDHQVARSDPARSLSTAGALFRSADGRHELWPWLLLAGLILLPLELLLANRTLA